jgi:hypothetical protein
MLRPVELLAPLRLPPPLFEPKNDPLLELALLVRLPDPRFFFTPLALDFSFHFLAPLKPPRRGPRPPRKLADPHNRDRPFGFCEVGRLDGASGIV